jgi:hypothetical protein
MFLRRGSHTAPFLKPQTITNAEYIAAVTRKFNFSATDLEVLYENQKGIIADPDAECDTTACKRAIMAEIENILPLYNVSEGGYSISWNYDALKLWYTMTCKELGIVPEGFTPTLKSVSVW